MWKAWKKWKKLFSNLGFWHFLKFYVSGKFKRGEKTENETAKAEMKQAIRELTYMERQFMFATAEFEPVAWHKYQAAQARVNALIKENKKERGVKECR